MRQTDIKQGDKVHEQITGFEGVVTGITDYITGCACILVQPPLDKDGKWVDSKWFDETRLEKTGEAVSILKMQRDTGPDKPAPRK